MTTSLLECVQWFHFQRLRLVKKTFLDFSTAAPITGRRFFLFNTHPFNGNSFNYLIDIPLAQTRIVVAVVSRHFDQSGMGCKEKCGCEWHERTHSTFMKNKCTDYEKTIIPLSRYDEKYETILLLLLVP